MAELLDHLRDSLRAAGIVRRPDEAGAGARPWLPPAWKHPDVGLGYAPGDAAQEKRPAVTFDDGLVVNLFMAPGLIPDLGGEDRREDGVDVVLRGNAVPTINATERAIRDHLLGDDPGGRTDWVMGALYVIQSRQWRPFQPIAAAAGVFTFSVGYIIEIRA